VRRVQQARSSGRQVDAPDFAGGGRDRGACRIERGDGHEATRADQVTEVERQPLALRPVGGEAPPVKGRTLADGEGEAGVRRQRAPDVEADPETLAAPDSLAAGRVPERQRIAADRQQSRPIGRGGD